MLLRVAGSIFVVGAASAAGFGAARSIENRVSELGRLEAGLVALGSSISYALTPLPLALGQAGGVAGGETGALLVLLGRSVGFQSGLTPSDALQEILATTPFPGIPDDAIAIIRDLARVLGTSGYKEQARYLELSLDRVRALLRLSALEWQKRARMYRYLGVLGGLLALVILL